MSTSNSDTLATEPATTQVPAGIQNRKQPFPQGFLDTISTGWADRPDRKPTARAQAPYAAARRQALSAAFPGASGCRERLVCSFQS